MPLLQHTLSNLSKKYAEAGKKLGKIEQILNSGRNQELHCTALVPCVLDRSKIFKTTFSLVDSEIIFNIYISISWVW